MNTIPTARILDRLDAHLAEHDYDNAERLLVYWLKEAESGGDDRGMLTVLNEQIGLYRKLEDERKGLAAMDRALALCEKEGVCGEVSVGTTLLNAATAYKAFGMAGKALPLYEKALKLYERSLDEKDSRFGGLYNNLALTLTELRRYRDARAYFLRALDIMNAQPGGACEQAITYLNLADLAMAERGEEDGAEEAESFCQKAAELLLDDDIEQDAHYRYTCERCAPVLGYYGFFAAEDELKARMEKAHEGTGAG